MSGNISLVTYGLAAGTYVILSVLLLTQWRVRPLGPSLLVASIATACWASTIAMGTLSIYPPVGLIQLLELSKNASWLFFLLQLLSFQDNGNIWQWMGRRWLPMFASAVTCALAVIAIRPLSAGLPWLDNFNTADTALMLWLVSAIAGLLLVEQLYRNAREEERWGVKFLCLGLGALFAFDFFMYAEALLFRQLNPQLWQARGVVTTLAMPWLLIAIARNRNWRMDVHVSRHVVFHTVTLMGAGLYLLAMAVIGYFIKFLGGDWGGVLQVSFLAGSGALLFTLLFSGTFRARLRVFLSKHFFSYRYDYREEWLRLTDGLASLTDVPAGVVSTMAPIALSPGGFVLHRNSANKYESSATWELDLPPVDHLGNLPKWLLETGWVIDLHEWRQSPDVYSHLELPEWLIRSDSVWLVVPLLFNQELEGILILAKTDLKSTVNWEDRDLLKTAGRQAAALLAQQRVSTALVEARQFDAFNRLSAYVIHDLKNILAQQSLMVANAQKHRENPAFIDDMIGTIENSVKRMQRLMDQMRSGLRTSEPRALDLSSLLDSAVATRSSSKPRPSLVCDSNGTVLADRERLITVFGHLIQNAQEATDDDGEVSVLLRTQDAQAQICIRDSGCGMSDEFVKEKLFKPFESTKGLTGMGIGVFESREYVRQLGGDIAVQSTPGKGSSFTVRLPLQKEASDLMTNEAESRTTNTVECDAGTPKASGEMAN